MVEAKRFEGVFNQPFDLRVDPPEKCHGLPMCDDKKSSQKVT